MKKYLIIVLLPLFVFTISCEDEDSPPPTEVTLWGVVYSVEDTEDLYLPNSNLSGSIPSTIGRLTNLEYLQLSENQLSGSIPSRIGNMTNLKYLLLKQNQLSGSIPSTIGKLTNLIDLDLRNNQLSGIIPDEICDINWQYDDSASLYGNQLCPPYPSFIIAGTQDTTNCN